MESSAAIAEPAAVHPSQPRAVKDAAPPGLLALIMLCALTTALILTVTAPLLASMVKDLARPGTGTFMIKLISGIIGPATIFATPVAGWLADRYDRRPLLVGLGIVYLVSAMAPIALESVGAIVVSRFIAGASSGALATISMTLVGHYYPPERRAGIIGLITFVILAASVVSLPVAGAMGAGGWRQAFYMFLVFVPLVILAALRPLPAAGRDPAQGAHVPQGGLTRVPVSLLLIAFVIGLALNLAGILYSFYFAELGLTDVSTVSLLLMYQAAVAGGSCLLFGKARSRLSGTQIFIICFTATSAGYIIQGLTNDWRVAGAALTLCGLSMGWLNANLTTTIIATVNERHHGFALGSAHAIASIAALLGIGDTVQDALGIKGIYLVVGAACALLVAGLVTGLVPLRRVEAEAAARR